MSPSTYETVPLQVPTPLHRLGASASVIADLAERDPGLIPAFTPSANAEQRIGAMMNARWTTQSAPASKPSLASADDGHLDTP